MKKIYFVLMMVFVVNVVQGQATVFSDDFSINQSATYTTSGVIGASSWSVVSGGNAGQDFGARRNTTPAQLELTNDATGASNVNGWVFTNVETSSFSSPYNTTLNLNIGTISWTFNMRQIRTDPAGFGAGSYGAAFILAGSSSTAATAGSGYAIALGQSGATDPIRLIKYNNGLQGTLTNIITSNTTGLTDFGINYLSIKVTYTPSTDTWGLFLRDDGATAFADPATGTLVNQGTAIDNAYTNIVLDYLGGFWSGSTTAAQTAFYDNVTVGVAIPTPTTTSISPSSATAGGSMFDITVNGTNFIDGISTVRWNGGDRTTTFVSATELTASIPAADIVSAGTATVTVLNTGNVTESNGQTFTINGTGMPTKLVITSVSPATPTRNSPFSITVQAQDNSDNPQNVTGDVTVDLTKTIGTGVLNGTLSNIITTGTNTIIFTGLTYDVAENGVELTASDAGALLAAGTTAFNVLDNASQLAFVGVPASGGTNNPVSAFTVEAHRPDNSIDDFYTGNITISKASGSGTLSGTTTVAAVAGVATFSTLQFDQADTYTLDATAIGLASATSGDIVITPASAASDYFRSAVTVGDWNSLSTWESSSDNAAWIPATLIPNENANTISIKTGDSITVSTAVSADQVIIETGAVLNNSAGIFTIMDGSGDDVIINTGGILMASSSATSPAFGAAGARVNINTGAILRIAKTGYTGNASGANAVNYVYQNASILEYTHSNQFSASGVTYFPNANAATIPIFRVSNALGGAVGGGSSTTINGLFESNVNIAFTGAGVKTFRNGITGTGNIDGIASGKFVINGATAVLGGSGTITLPTAGLDISTTVDLQNAKSLTGNIALLTNGYVQLGSNDLIVTGNITGGSATSYIITNSTGSLIVGNVTAATTFPVGNGTSYTPATITNTGTADDFAVNVTVGTPCNADPNQSVNRVWNITEAVAGGSIADITMQWNATEENPTFIRLACAAVHCSAGVIDIKGTTGAAGGPNPPYTQTITGISSFSPFGVSSDPVPLPITIAYFRGAKQGAIHSLSWKVNCATSSKVTMTIERSSDGRAYAPINSITADGVRCLDAFVYNDVAPLPGLNYYRLKSVDIDGKITYSSIVTLLNKENGFEIVNITPNPGSGQFKLNITTTEKTTMEILITDIQGRVVSKTVASLISGFNAVELDANKLTAGMYRVYGNTAAGKTKVLSFVKQ